jgi:hypothetical protein
VKRAGALPPLLRRALAPRSAHCYRHCERPIRGRTLVRAPGPGWLCVYACPGGAVSVVTYSEWASADPTPRFLRYVKGHTIPPTFVRRRDFRLARRHGPELGRVAERFLSRVHPPRPVVTVYWRLYPFRKKDGTPYRLFACFRHGADRPQFFVAPRDSESPRCSRCPARTK